MRTTAATLLLFVAGSAQATSFVEKCFRELPVQLRCEVEVEFQLSVAADGTSSARVLSLKDELLRPFADCIARQPKRYFGRLGKQIPPGAETPVVWKLSDESCAPAAASSK